MKKTIEIKYLTSFIFRFIAIALIGFGISGLLLVILLNKKIGPTYIEGISTLSHIRTALPQIILITAFTQAIMLSSITLLIALLWSHSIAGPVARFRKHLKNIAQGKLLSEPVFFRETDQLHALANALSEMIISHKENRAQALALLVEAQKVLDEYKTEQPLKQTKLLELKKIYSRIKGLYAAKNK